MRVGELLNLCSTDIREIHDRSRNKTTFLRVDGKTGEHMVPIQPQLARRLKLIADHKQDSNYIFLTNRRNKDTHRYEQLTKSGVEQLVRRLAKEAGIEKRIYPHLMRHAFITWCRSRGVPMNGSPRDPSVPAHEGG